MSERLNRIGVTVCTVAERLFAPALARTQERCDALEREYEDLKAALAGNLPEDHPMAQHVAFMRQYGGWR